MRGQVGEGIDCSFGVLVALYWRHLVDEDQKAHIDAMVAALFNALQGEPRRWSPPAEAHTKALFRRGYFDRVLGEAYRNSRSSHLKVACRSACRHPHAGM